MKKLHEARIEDLIGERKDLRDQAASAKKPDDLRKIYIDLKSKNRPYQSPADRNAILGALLVKLAELQDEKLERSLYGLEEGSGYWSCPNCSSLGEEIAKELNNLEYYDFDKDDGKPEIGRFGVWMIFPSSPRTRIWSQPRVLSFPSTALML